MNEIIVTWFLFPAAPLPQPPTHTHGWSTPMYTLVYTPMFCLMITINIHVLITFADLKAPLVKNLVGADLLK